MRVQNLSAWRDIQLARSAHEYGILAGIGIIAWATSAFDKSRRRIERPGREIALPYLEMYRRDAV